MKLKMERLLCLIAFMLLFMVWADYRAAHGPGFISGWVLGLLLIGYREFSFWVEKHF